MTWLADNWFWVLIFIAFIAMHMFDHGGHGGHGGHGVRDRPRSPADKTTTEASGRAGSTPADRHQH